MRIVVFTNNSEIAGEVTNLTTPIDTKELLEDLEPIMAHALERERTTEAFSPIVVEKRTKERG